jgi:hypothetical protein
MERYRSEIGAAPMLRRFTDLRGYTIGAADGDVGSLEDAYFEDHAHGCGHDPPGQSRRVGTMAATTPPRNHPGTCQSTYRSRRDRPSRAPPSAPPDLRRMVRPLDGLAGTPGARGHTGSVDAPVTGVVQPGGRHALQERIRGFGDNRAALIGSGLRLRGQCHGGTWGTAGPSTRLLVALGGIRDGGSLGPRARRERRREHGGSRDEARHDRPAHQHLLALHGFHARDSVRDGGPSSPAMQRNGHRALPALTARVVSGADGTGRSRPRHCHQGARAADGE